MAPWEIDTGSWEFYQLLDDYSARLVSSWSLLALSRFIDCCYWRSAHHLSADSLSLSVDDDVTDSKKNCPWIGKHHPWVQVTATQYCCRLLGRWRTISVNGVYHFRGVFERALDFTRAVLWNYCLSAFVAYECSYKNYLGASGLPLLSPRSIKCQFIVAAVVNCRD